MRIKTQLDVARATPGRHSDTKATGLHLIVSADRQHRRFLFRYTKPSTGRVTELGLGSTTLFTLAEARDKVIDYRRTVARGEDPADPKREQGHSAHGPTFEEVAAAFIAAKQPGWRSQSYRRSMDLLLMRHAAALAQLPVVSISTNDVEAAVRTLWKRAPLQGRRVLGALSQVFYYAQSKGLCSSNPAEWKILRHQFPRQRTNGNHFTALDYVQLPSFVRQLHIAQQHEKSLGSFVIEFVLLTACRSSEAGGMQWSEVDFNTRIWTIPATRMKAGHEHKVPLSGRAMALLEHQRETSDTYVWQGRGLGPISTKTLYMYLTKSMGIKATIHGFRSSFRDWAGNETEFARETIEECLSHAVGNATEKAYRRKLALAKMRALLEAWAAYLSG